MAPLVPICAHSKRSTSTSLVRGLCACFLWTERSKLNCHPAATALEAQVFSIQYPDSFWTLYSPTAHKYREAMDTFLDALNEMATSVSSCFTMTSVPQLDRC